jgi:hypothetical protein
MFLCLIIFKELKGYFSSVIKYEHMNKKIIVTISKEDIFDVEALISEIKRDPKDAFAMCEVHGIEGFDFDAFSDFDSLTSEAKDRLLADLATSKATADAALSYNQVDIFDPVPEFFEEQD